MGKCLGPCQAIPVTALFTVDDTGSEMGKDELKRKALIKAGAKRGKEILASTKELSLKYFCTAVDDCDGDLHLLNILLAAINSESQEIGKMLFSAGPDRLAIVASVPEEKQDEVDCCTWLQHVIVAIGGELQPHSTNRHSQALVVRNPQKDEFPLKIKEPGITAAIDFLKRKGLFLSGDGDSDDEIVYGETDFPL